MRIVFVSACAYLVLSTASASGQCGACWEENQGGGSPYYHWFEPGPLDTHICGAEGCHSYSLFGPCQYGHLECLGFSSALVIHTLTGSQTQAQLAR